MHVLSKFRKKINRAYKRVRHENLTDSSFLSRNTYKFSKVPHDSEAYSSYTDQNDSKAQNHHNSQPSLLNGS